MKCNTDTQPLCEIKDDVTALFPTKVSADRGITRIYANNAGRYLLTEGKESDVIYTVDGNVYTESTDIYLERGFHHIGYIGAESPPELVLIKVDEVAPYSEIVFFGTINTENGQNKDIKVSVGEHSVYTDKNGDYEITVPATENGYGSIVFEKEGYRKYEKSLDGAVITLLGEADLGTDIYELIPETENIEQPKNTGKILILIGLSLVGIALCIGTFIVIKKKKKRK